MNTPMPAQQSADDIFGSLDEFDSPCGCGHRHAEHSLFGSCHGCTDCDDSDDEGETHDHPYQRCACTDFQLAVEVDFDASAFALTG